MLKLVRVEKTAENTEIPTKNEEFCKKVVLFLSKRKSAKNRPNGQSYFCRQLAFEKGQISRIWPTIGQVGHPALTSQT